MFLPEFNSTAMQRKPGEVFAAALKQPIVINRLSHDGVVMMSKKKYAELVKAAEANK